MTGDETTAGNRPPLTEQGLLEEIETVLDERTPLYANTADLVIDTGRATVEEICEIIITELRNSGIEEL
jgi:shikimate kinase